MGRPRVVDADDRPPREGLLDATLAVWQPRADRNLTKEDARQIVENVVGFFDVLARWSVPDVRHDRAA
jgi:hypothetical protein